jgi:hypothetical protein
MIDYESCEIDDTAEFTVVASNKIFKELGNNNYNYLDLISELIDNSIGGRIKDTKVNVQIHIGISSKDRSKSFFLIRDDGGGISRSELPIAISPAAKSGGNSLNEHGLGMKQSIAAIGTLKYLATKTIDDNDAIIINTFKYGQYQPRKTKVEWNHGTEICISNLKGIVKLNPQSYTMSLVPYLGARYRKYLTDNAPKLSIELTLLSLDILDENNQPLVTNRWNIQKVEPTYFHPNYRTNRPVVEKKVFKGTKWKAELTLGYAPRDIEYEHLNISKPHKYEPYHVSLSKQGFDIIRNNRIIKFHQLSEVNLATRHPDLNSIRGEINLIKGFTSAITKNSIIADEPFNELIEKIKTFLDENDYLDRENVSSEIPEALLRDRLADCFRYHSVYKKNDVRTEYSIGNLNGKIDIFADDEAWEIKTRQVNGLDVYQLFAYLDMGNIKKGYLVAKSITTGGLGAIDHITKKHNKTIVFSPIHDWNISNMPSEEERKKYY